MSYMSPPDEEKKEKRLGYYFEVKEKERTCHLTDEGIRKAEELAGVESFYTAGNMEWPHLDRQLAQGASSLPKGQAIRRDAASGNQRDERRSSSMNSRAA